MSRGRDNDQDRNQRVPLGVPRMKLSAPERPGYVRRWVNDTVGRIQAAEAGGYKFVKKERVGDVPGDVTQQHGMGENTSMIVGRNEDGSAITAYLMEIKKEWYDQDQASKQAAIKRKEDSFRKGADEHGSPGNDQRYIPREGIKIQN